MKAIIPAAGLGTRFLPATKCSAKELLPVLAGDRDGVPAGRCDDLPFLGQFSPGKGQGSCQLPFLDGLQPGGAAGQRQQHKHQYGCFLFHGFRR